jgi:3-dehydroquinate dehydratase-2
LRWFQSNIEGEMVSAIQESAFDNSPQPARGLIINAAAYTHTSLALYDAVELFQGPSIEIHLSNTSARESFRHHSFMSLVCDGIIQGFGRDSYLLAIRGISSKLAKAS